MINNILPADTYTVINKTILNESDKKIITMLYQPIIGYTSVSLYLTLLDDLQKLEILSEEQTHHHLMSTMQLKLNDIVIAREKLEAVGLLKTYVRNDHINSYVYVIFSPMNANEFFNHPVLNVVLYNNLGKKEYNKLINCFKVPRINLKDYNDITKKFNEVFTSVSGNVFIENDNIIARNQESIKYNNSIDFDMMISSIPKSMLNEKCFNEEIKELITSLAFIYKIDELNMQVMVRNSLNEKGSIDKTELRKQCRNFYQFEENGKLPTLIYSKQPEYLKTPKGDSSNWAKQVYTFENVTPYDYLSSKYKHGEPSMRELMIIENLMTNLKMKPGVINVLIDYVLRVNNQKFTKNYVDTVASQWARLNIETVEEAMKTAEKEHKKIKKILNNKETTKNKIVKSKEVVPSWFDKEIESTELSEEEQKELDEMLKEFS